MRPQLLLFLLPSWPLGAALMMLENSVNPTSPHSMAAQAALMHESLCMAVQEG